MNGDPDLASDRSLPALVPAAGQSRRMGRPKLTLPLGSRTVIQRVVLALLEGGADPVLVIVPSLAEPGALDLQREAAQSGAVVVPCPSQTPDMRATVERGLIALDKLAPDYPGLLLLPGDCPGVTAQVVATVRRRFLAHPDHAVVPVHGERRGHPLALPRRLCRRIPQLPMEVGINSLLRDPHEIVIPVEVDDPKILADLDTPDDYRRWSRP